MPAIANIIKKNIKIIIVSRRRGSALKSAKTSNFKPLIVEIVLRGLKTRKALSPFRLNEEEDD